MIRCGCRLLSLEGFEMDEWQLRCVRIGWGVRGCEGGEVASALRFANRPMRWILRLVATNWIRTAMRLLHKSQKQQRKAAFRCGAKFECSTIYNKIIHKWKWSPQRPDVRSSAQLSYSLFSGFCYLHSMYSVPFSSSFMNCSVISHIGNVMFPRSQQARLPSGTAR